MVNKTQFHKTKIAMAVVVSLGLAACGDDGSVTTGAENTITQAQQQTGTVQGVVVDTNGNPIEGAAVFLGAAETVTNAGGQYIFSDVAVTNVNGVNNEGNENDDDITQSLVITIVGTDAYLGALVTVTPESQVNNTGGQGEDQNGGNSDVTAQSFVDGFTAVADVAVLPMLNAGAYGYIRHCETGQPLLNTADLLSLDFVTIDADADDNIDSDQITNAEDNHAISSDENGMFSLANLAANSTYTITAKKGWAVTSPTGTITVDTSSEDSSQFMGTIEVCPVEFVEADVTVAPWIKAIDGQIGNSTITDNSIDYAALNQGVVNDFVIWFSEEMASTFDLTEARVKVIAPGETLSETVADATVTLAADGKSATVTFVTDLAEGSKVDVWFPHWTALDANDDLFLVDNAAIDWDEVAVTTATKAVYTHAFFCTFNKPDDAASVVLGPQIFDADTTEDGNYTDLAEYSTAFQDNRVAASNVISQLNDGDADSATRLTDLANARLTPATVTIVQDYAVVSYDSTNAASIVWTLNDAVVTPTTVLLSSDFVTSTDALGITTLHINNAAHDDVITATPVNGFGDVITAGTMTVTLVDAIAPTTVLQESYNITDATGPRSGEDLVGGTTANASFGNGGEVSAPGTTATAAGEPIIHIQPRHLDGAGDRNEELNALTSGMSARLTAAKITALGGATAAQTAMSVSTIAGHQMPIYDATAAAEWADVPATIGVAFNEDVTLTSTAPAFSGSTTLSSFAALNDVAADVDGNVVAVDLVTFATPSVVALSLDAGADLGFVGSVTDSRGNTSTANAQVFVQDTFPPMMTAAVWNGDTLTLTFNEAPVLTTGANITVIDPENTTNSTTIAVSATNTVIAGNVMTITLTSGQNVLVAPLFVDGANDEFLYNDDATATDDEQHALIDWDNIADATSNEWSEFNPTLSVSNRGLEAAPVANDTRRWEVVAPRFLAVNAVGPFTYTVATAGYEDSGAGGDDDGDVVYTITFTHPIDLGLNPGINHFTDAIALNDGIVTPDPVTALSYSTSTAAGAAVLNGLFNMDLNGDLVLDAEDSFSTGVVSATVTNGSITISNGNTTLMLTISADDESIIFGTSTFGFATTVTSAINGLETSAGNFNWQNNN